MQNPNEHLYDYAPQMAEALTDIAKALGITDADFYNNPEKAQSFGWEAADRINTLTEATGSNPSGESGAVPSPVPSFTSPLPDLDDPSVVAVLRLPISVSHLVPISNLMEKVYGPGLRTPSPGQFFVLRRPEAPTGATAKTTAPEETTDARA